MYTNQKWRAWWIFTKWKQPFSQHPYRVRTYQHSLVPLSGCFPSSFIIILTSSKANLFGLFLNSVWMKSHNWNSSSGLTPQQGTHSCVAYSLNGFPHCVIYSIVARQQVVFSLGLHQVVLECLWWPNMWVTAGFVPRSESLCHRICGCSASESSATHLSKELKPFPLPPSAN